MGMGRGAAGVIIGDALSSFFVIVISWCDTLFPLAAATAGTKDSAINPKAKHLAMKVSFGVSSPLARRASGPWVHPLAGWLPSADIPRHNSCLLVV